MLTEQAHPKFPAQRESDVFRIAPAVTEMVPRHLLNAFGILTKAFELLCESETVRVMFFLISTRWQGRFISVLEDSLSLTRHLNDWWGRRKFSVKMRELKENLSNKEREVKAAGAVLLQANQSGKFSVVPRGTYGEKIGGDFT